MHLLQENHGTYRIIVAEVMLMSCVFRVCTLMGAIHSAGIQPKNKSMGYPDKPEIATSNHKIRMEITHDNEGVTGANRSIVGILRASRLKGKTRNASIIYSDAPIGASLGNTKWRLELQASNGRRS